MRVELVSYSLLAATGLVIWWPGAKTWRRHLVVHRRATWKRFIWELHSTIGFWSLLFISAYRLPGGVAATVNALQPLFVVALSWALLGAPLRWAAVGAALGGVVGVALSAFYDPTPPVAFDANHPFVFAICDVRTGLILFLGRVERP